MLDFDELMRKKYGDDYDVFEHATEIFPEDKLDKSEQPTPEEAKPEEDGQGESSKTSD